VWKVLKSAFFTAKLRLNDRYFDLENPRILRLRLVVFSTAFDTGGGGYKTKCTNKLISSVALC
jgi:hypothetical protein